MRTRLRPFAVVAGLAIVISACGSDDNDDSAATTPDAATTPGAAATTGAPETTGVGGESTTPGSAAPPSGDPIKIMAMGQLQASSFSFPGIGVGAQAAVDEINEAGGIHGRPLEVIVCNDESNPNVAAACARQAVSENVVALVGGVSLYTNDVFPILDENTIPMIGASPLNTGAETSAMSFPVDANATHFAAQGTALVEHRGCEKIGVIYADNATATQSGQYIQKGIELAGGEVVKALSISDTTPDAAPAVSTLIDAGAECFATALAPAMLVKFVTSVRTSTVPEAPIASTIGSLPLAIVEPLGDAAEGILVGTNMAAATDPVWTDASARLQAVDSSVPVETFGLLTYSAVHTFATIAEAIDGEITGASVAEQAGKSSAVQGIGYPAPVDFTKPGPAAKTPRLFNTNVLMYEVKDGTYARIGDPIDVTAVMEAGVG